MPGADCVDNLQNPHRAHVMPRDLTRVPRAFCLARCRARTKLAALHGDDAPPQFFFEAPRNGDLRRRYPAAALRVKPLHRNAVLGPADGGHEVLPRLGRAHPARAAHRWARLLRLTWVRLPAGWALLGTGDR